MNPRLTKSLQEGDINREFMRFHDKWCNTVNSFQAFKPKMSNKFRIWTGDCHELHDTLFWVYASVIFACNVFYFALRILRYKMGFLPVPAPPKKGVGSSDKERKDSIGREVTGAGI